MNRTHDVEALKKELDQLLAKRDAIHEKQIKSYMEGSATRAKTTTLNAEVGRVNDRIVWIREELKNMENAA